MATYEMKNVNGIGEFSCACFIEDGSRVLKVSCFCYPLHAIYNNHGFKYV